jgi:predicted FMN-binding regulatory protein PaiB
MADAIGYKISTGAKATSGSRMIPHLAALMRATRSLSAIRVIDFVVDEIEGQAKLNQHRSDEDHVAVADRLAQAKEEDAVRPGLEYGGEGGLANGSRETRAR